MQSFKDSFAFWSSVLGTVLGFLGVYESSRLFAIAGTLFVGTAAIALAVAARERRRLRSASLTIEGRKIDSLNLANLGRRLNHSLVVQEADQTVTINGEDASITWLYTGYCQAPTEAAVEFSIHTENHVPFNRLDCVAHDLRNDAQRLHSIRPILVGSDGISKTVAVPLAQPMKAKDPFAVLLRCTLRGCMKSGIDYYAATTSVSQDAIPIHSVRIAFVRDYPSWVRAYECDAAGTIRLLRDLRPATKSASRIEYVDIANGVNGQAARIYVFQRAESLKKTKTSSTKKFAA